MLSGPLPLVAAHLVGHAARLRRPRISRPSSTRSSTSGSTSNGCCSSSTNSSSRRRWDAQGANMRSLLPHSDGPAVWLTWQLHQQQAAAQAAAAARSASVVAQQQQSAVGLPGLPGLPTALPGFVRASVRPAMRRATSPHPRFRMAWPTEPYECSACERRRTLQSFSRSLHRPPARVSSSLSRLSTSRASSASSWFEATSLLLEQSPASTSSASLFRYNVRPSVHDSVPVACRSTIGRRATDWTPQDRKIAHTH